MNNIKVRSGVVLLHAGGEFLLVADSEARKICPYVRQINAAAAYYWRLFEQNMSFAEISACSCAKFNVSEGQQMVNIMRFVHKFMEAGYLVKVPR